MHLQYACIHQHLWVLTHPQSRGIFLTIKKMAETRCETRMIKLYQRIYQATQIKAVVIKHLDLSVTGGSEEKKEPGAN